MRKAISIVLTVLLLASSTGITYAKHFCGGFEVISTITFGEEYLSCGMVMNADSCNDTEEEGLDCCKNQYKQIDIDDNFANSSFQVNLNVPFLASFISVFVLQVIEYQPQSLHSYSYYDPPPLDKDISVLYQVFVI